MVAADFQSVLAALILLQRTEDGRYPPRNPLQDPWLLPMTEAVRQTIITVAVDRGHSGGGDILGWFASTASAHAGTPGAGRYRTDHRPRY